MPLTEGFTTRSSAQKMGYSCVGPPKQGHLEKRKKAKTKAVEVLKFNPNHSKEDGKFTSGSGGGTTSGQETTTSASRSSSKESLKGKHPKLDEAQREMQRKLREQKRQRLHVVDTPDQAVGLILKGERVVLKDTQQVHTVLSKLGELAIQAKKDGKDAQNWDPCSITVKGTSLFCNSKIKTREFPNGVPRIEMPQFKSKNPVRGSPADNMTRDENGEVNATQAFLDDLAKSGVKSSDVTVPAGKLKASQSEMEGTKVAGMMLAKDRDPKKQRITVSSDNYVVDGHHTWAAAVGRDAEDGNLDNDAAMEVVKINLPMSQIYQRAIDWTERMGLPKVGVKKWGLVEILRYVN